MTMNETCFWIDPTQDPDEHGGYVPSIVTENEPGHSRLVGDPAAFQAPWVWGATLDAAEKVAAAANKEKGVNAARALDIIASSMFGKVT